MPPAEKPCDWRQLCRDAGFDLFGALSLEAFLKGETAHVFPFKKQVEALREWLAQGKNAQMAWMEKSLPRRAAPQSILEGAQSVLCVGLSYLDDEPAKDRPPALPIAAYARRKDYHKVLSKKLKGLCRALQAQGGVQKFYADTGPVLEKAFAAAAGLGWQGKNTLLVNPKWGSSFCIGIVFTTLKLAPSAPLAARCGSCERCVQACPTGALSPYFIDARKCLAYLTIEHEGPLPAAAAAKLKASVFGCDLCRRACPWQARAKARSCAELAPVALPAQSEAPALLNWTQEDFLQTFAQTPLKRAGLARFKRNLSAFLEAQKN